MTRHESFDRRRTFVRFVPRWASGASCWAQPVLLLSLTAGLVSFASRAEAQAVYGSIAGTVTDQSGAVIAGATVTATDVRKGTSRQLITNSTGGYNFQDLIPDPYVVKVQANGFATAVNNTVNVTTDSAARLDIQMKVGAGNQTVEVTSAAPELKTNDVDVATQINTLTVQELPNLLRNTTSLVLLAPGTTASTFSNAPAEDAMRSIPIAANGQSPFSAGFVLDGADDKDSFIGEAVVNPPLDSIEEMKFINQNYDAEFGAAIAGVTVMTTKSGSNSFHGDLYDFRRSDAQQARDPFTQYPGSNVIGPVVPATLSNIFGGSIGGPILKNKLFFFGDYQGTRQKIGSSFFDTVPTALVHQTCTGTTGNCDLSEYLNGGQNQVYDPDMGALNSDGANTGVGRTPFANNQIPNSRLSPAAINLLNIIPSPTVSGIFNNYPASGFGVFNFNQFDVRIDTQLRQTMHVFGRYGYLGSNQSAPASLGEAGGTGFGPNTWAGNENGGNDDLALGADIVVSPKLLTDFRVTWFRYQFVESKYDGQTPLMTNLGWLGLNTAIPGSGGASQIAIDGLTDLGSGNDGANHCNCPLDMNEQEWGFANNWTYTQGRHSIKVGAEIRRLHQLRVPSDTNRTGELAFVQGRTALGAGGGANEFGLGLASFLFGDVSTMTRYASTSTTAAETQWRLFSYIGDDWRVTNKLTLNFGGRWEIYVPETVNGKGQGGFYNTENDMIEVAGYGPFGMNLNIKNNWAFLAPRFGVTYQFTPKSVFRAGLGRAFDPGFYGDMFSAVLTQTIPVLQDQSFTQLDGLATDAARNPSNNSVYNIAVAPDAPPVFAVPASGEFLLPPGQTYRSRPDKQNVPDVWGWNVSYQRQFTPTTAFTVAYVANKAAHAIPSSTWGGVNWNDPPLSGYELNLPCEGAPFYQAFGDLYPVADQCGPGYATYFDDEANAHYDSIQLVLEKRMSNGLQLNASFVQSTTWGVGSGGYFVQDPHSNWGHFDFNRPSDLKFYGTYNLPFGRGQMLGANMNSLANAIVGGFALHGDFELASGLPYTISYTECRDDAPNGDMPCRPNQVGSFSLGASSLNPTGHYSTYFTPVAALASNGQTSGAFQRPAVYTFGNVPYNSEFGPGLFTGNLTLQKAIPIHESMALNLEVMAQNVFNHANLANPGNTCIDCTVSSGAGQITDILGGTFAGMRELQFDARVSF
jgi:hypothetical protein